MRWRAGLPGSKPTAALYTKAPFDKTAAGSVEASCRFARKASDCHAALRSLGSTAQRHGCILPAKIEGFGSEVTDSPRSLAVAAGANAVAHNPITGILLKIVSVAVFVGMSTCIKAAGAVPAGPIVFFRSFFAIFPIIAFLAFKGQLRTAFSTRRPLTHIARGLVGVCAMGLSFFALTRLPLPDAVTL